MTVKGGRRPKRRRKRERVGLVAGIFTAVSVVVLVLAMAAGALFVSGVVPLAGLQRYVAADLQKRLGSSWAVTTSKAAIVRVDGSPVLQVRNAEFVHVSGLRLKAPEADIQYDPWAALRGDIRLRSIDIHGVNLRLAVDKNGALTIATDGSSLAFPATGELERPAPLDTLAAMLTGLLDDDSLFPGLDRIALTGGRMMLVSPAGDERIGLENVAIRLNRGQGTRELTVTGRSATGVQDIRIASRSDNNDKRHLDISVYAFRLDSLERLLFGQSSAVLDGFPVRGELELIDVGTPSARLQGSLVIGAGRLRSPDGGEESIGFESLRASFNGDLALSRLLIPAMSIQQGQTDLSLTGEFRRGEGPAWQFDGSGSGVVAGEGNDPSFPLQAASVKLSGEGIRKAVLDELTLNGPELTLTGSGHAAQTPEGPEVYAQLNVRQTSARTLLAVWPNMMSAIIRKLLVERIEAGEIEALDLALAMSPAALRAARAGDPTPDETVNVSVSGKGVRFIIGDGIPKLLDAAISARGTGRTLDVAASSGRLDLDNARVIQLSEGSFTIADTLAKRPIGRSSFRATGAVDALAALLAMPAFREASPGKVDPARVKGRFDLRTTVSLPLIEQIRPSDVMVQSSGSITALASDTLLGNDKLEAGTLAAAYDRGNLTLRGEARISGTPAQIDLRQDPRAVGEVTLTMTMDQAARQRRGLDFGNTVAGALPIRVVKPLGRRPDAPLRLEVDLTRAAIDGLLPGWVKPAGRAGKLSFTLAEPSDDSRQINELVLDSPPVLVRGRMTLSAAGAVQSASFVPFRLSAGDDMRIEARRDGSVSKLVIRGQVADARSFLRKLTAAGAPAGTRPAPGEPPADLDVDLALPILTGFNDEVVVNATLRLSARNREIRTVDFTGRIGREPITVQHTNDGNGRRLKVSSSDGGALLRYLDIYRRAYGGALVLDARPTAESVIGEIAFRNFRVQGEPALRRVLGEQFVQQSADGVRVSRPRDAGNNVEFSQLKANFTRTPTRIDIRNGVIIGNEIGVSGQGFIDYGRDRTDIAGTFVPGFVLNNAFAQVPVLGPLLGGGQNEGMFAVNFRVSGPASAPSMSVNPLSAIAPGILRRFVDPLGGAMNGTGTVPQSPAP
ncbi:MAG: hypothetical protein NT037_10780 [Hyphomicrobiales bacterium]|nr:hypothetical protein [Hyphomicrobiales bacterium]